MAKISLKDRYFIRMGFVIGITLSVGITLLCLLSSYFLFLFGLIYIILIFSVHKESLKTKNVEILIKYEFEHEIPVDMCNEIINDYVYKIDEIRLISKDPRITDNIKIIKKIYAYKDI